MRSIIFLLLALPIFMNGQGLEVVNYKIDTIINDSIIIKPVKVVYMSAEDIFNEELENFIATKSVQELGLVDVLNGLGGVGGLISKLLASSRAKDKVIAISVRGNKMRKAKKLYNRYLKKKSKGKTCNNCYNETEYRAQIRDYLAIKFE